MVSRVALVQMGSTPERDARNTIQQAGSKYSCMTLYTHGRETWNIVKGNLFSAFKAVRQTPKP